MQSSTFFDKYSQQLEYLHTLGQYQDKHNFICPICLKEFDNTSVNSLSLEDVPQYALGGHKRLLTCKECNNLMGHRIDCHLINYIDAIEKRDFPDGLKSPVLVRPADTDLVVNGIITSEKGEFKLLIADKCNDPKKLKALDGVDVNSIISVQFKDTQSKRIPQNIISAILKNAYLILLEKFGYTFLLNKYYDDIRRKIILPAEAHFSYNEYISLSDHSVIEDGIYFVNEPKLKGYFVQYTIAKIKQYKCVVFIPLPIMDYFQVVNELNTLKINMLGIKVKRINNDLDCFCSLDYIISRAPII